MDAIVHAGPLRHFLQFRDFSHDEILYVLERARLIKDKFKRYQPHHTLHDRTLAMVFEKASTRTRVSFEAGMYQLGGSVIHLTTTDSQLGRSEPIEDTARVVSRMVDIVMIRTFEQTRLERFASHSRVPVINGLTNEFHPCQILADIFTFIEHRGDIKGKTVAWIGDANNMAYTGCKRRKSWALPCMYPLLMVTTWSQIVLATRTPASCANLTTRWKPARAHTWSPPTCGPAWVTKPRTKSVAKRLPTGVWTRK
jgi:hypothetical protein